LWLENWNEKGLGLNLWWRYSELTEEEKEKLKLKREMID